MSSTVMLIFPAGQIKKIKNWFKKVCPKDTYPELPVPESSFRPKECERGIYVEFQRNIMTLDVAIWDDIGSCYSTLLGQELGKKFGLKNAGWDSVGYCMEDFMKARGLLSHVWKEKDLDEYKWRIEAEIFFRKKAVELVDLKEKYNGILDDIR